MTKMIVKSNYFRVSVKALIIKHGKILLIQEPDGLWELPGGGLRSNESPKHGLIREIKEEMGIKIKIKDLRPFYAWTLQVTKKNGKKANRLFLAYWVSPQNFKFKKTKEAIDFKFFKKEELKKIKLHFNLASFKDIFNPRDFH